MNDKNINIRFSTNSDQVKKEFDGVDVSVKELQIRLADLNKQMRQLNVEYGKNAPQTASYARIIREQEMATAQLVNMQEKEIAVTRQSVRGLGSLGSASIAALGSVSGLGTGVSVLTNSLMSGVGLTAGLAAGVIGLSLFVNWLSNVREEAQKTIKDIQGTTKELIKIQDIAKGGFNIKEGQIPEALKLVKKQLADIEMLSMSSHSMKVAYEGETTALKETIKVLEDAKTKEETRLHVIELLNKAGLTYAEEIDEQNKKLDKQREIIKDIYAIAGNPRPAVPPRMAEAPKGIVTGFGIENEGKRKAGGGSVSESFREEMNTVNKMIADSANLMSNEFRDAWEKIFGEANSLWEKFFQMILSDIAELAAMRVATSIFGWLFGGPVGGGAAAAVGAVAAGGNRPIVLQIGTDTVAQFVRRGNGYLEERGIS